MAGKVLTAIVLLAALIGGLLTSWYEHKSDMVATNESTFDSIAQQRQYHHPITFVAQLKNDPHAGEKIYHNYCQSCHASEPVVDVDAPRIGDSAAWQPILKHGKKQVLRWTLDGHKKMPEHGGCFECSDHQVEMAMQYLLSKTSVLDEKP